MTPEVLTSVRLTCLSNVHAVQFRDYLMRRGVVVDAVDDTVVVLSYLGDPLFVQNVTTEAVLGNYADAALMADLLAAHTEASEPVAGAHSASTVAA